MSTRVAAALRSVEMLNEKLNAVVYTSEKPAEPAIKGGLLEGVPILVKDSIDVANMPTVCGLATRKADMATVYLRSHPVHHHA